MGQYEENMRQLYRLKCREAQLETMVGDLQIQKQRLAQKLKRLRAAASAEHKDVERLEGRSLAAFFYAMTGRMEEKLSKERREAYAARVKYDAAAREYAAVLEDLHRYGEALERLRGSGERYDRLLHQKAAALKAAGGPAGAELLRLEERIAGLESQEQELQEALDAGRQALNDTDTILDRLMKAGNWATVDMVGGGLGSSMMKHGFLDEAQELVERLQVQLRRFRTELLDVAVDAEIQVRIDGSLRFADYFFDDLFADWVVMDKIMQSRERVQQVRGQIADLVTALENTLADTQRERARTQAALERYILQTELT